MLLMALLTIIGVLLVGLTFFDVFVTVLHPEAESPFSSRLQMTVWQALRTLSRPLRGRSRHRVLGLAVPLLIVTLITTWATLLVLGFGIIYAAWIGVPDAFNVPKVSGGIGFGDAMYFSGVTLGTIGYGDFQPIHPLLRLTSVVEGFAGIAVISMSIAYVLEVYPVLQRKSVLAVLLNEETGGQAHGLPLLVRYLKSGHFETLAGILRSVNLELLFLAEAHRRLPVLHYGHPVDVERSFLRVLLIVQNLVGALRYGMRSGEGLAWSEDPRIRNLEDSFFYALYTLGSSLHLPLTTPLDKTHFNAQAAEAFRNLCGQLASIGLPTPASPDILSAPDDKGASPSEYERAYAGFVRFHVSSDTALVSYLQNTGYTYEEASRAATRPEMLVRELDATQ